MVCVVVIVCEVINEDGAHFYDAIRVSQERLNRQQSYTKSKQAFWFQYGLYSGTCVIKAVCIFFSDSFLWRGLGGRYFSAVRSRVSWAIRKMLLTEFLRVLMSLHMFWNDAIFKLTALSLQVYETIAEYGVIQPILFFLSNLCLFDHPQIFVQWYQVKNCCRRVHPSITSRCFGEDFTFPRLLVA